ncbi:MAG: transglycosylase domain-containing protein, partial [Anaerolineales bacterium]|nr:transglycosylase domain-containing protein [Anaerolineales bacterium]
MSRSIQLIRRRRMRPQARKRGTTTAVFFLLILLLFTPVFLLGSAALTAVFLSTLFPLPNVAQLETLPQQMQPSATPSEIYSSGTRPQLLDQIIPPVAPWQPLAQLPPAVGEAALAAAGDNGLADVAMALVQQHLLPANPNDNFFTTWLRQRQTRQLQQQLLTRYSREQLLEWYVNSRYYGQLAFGIEAAAQSYLGKTAVFLTLPEAVTLAALPGDPTFDAFATPAQLQPRREAIFNALVTSGKLDPTTAQLARDTPVLLQP